ncbi:hypothetical protein Glove_82g85 [Diversispora epigaea]|uniref:Protein kinase domain-containing protein n=1 Tax=Diversispora epigaea TaxID=1348612 RepID=A0A397J7V1_9GLOM|nr:hypothetical protein Glove_82g85 [Diversispora epigaea]
MATQEICWNEKLIMFRDKIILSLDPNIHKTITDKGEYLKNMIQNNKSFTEIEKKFLLNELHKTYDAVKIGDDSVGKQQCNNCQNWHQATQYCEFCIRKYLENNFGNWTSRNDEIDKFIQECQQKTVTPRLVIEWISYDQFENIEHLKEGGCASIYTAIWKNGSYYKWNSEKQILERYGRHKVILKKLNNSNSNSVKWFQEVTLSFTLKNICTALVKCFGLTKDPITNDYMLVMRCYENDLRHFLKDNYHSLTWLQKYKIIHYITISLDKIHKENIVHRDLHSGNILYNAYTWVISDLGLSGPVDKPLNSIYGNLPYIAPEVLCGQMYTTKSDIYSLGILMWEIATSETPFGEREHDLDLQFAIINGYRPKIYEDIPQEFVSLMKRCWDANPDNRPDANTIHERIRLLIKLLYDEMDKQQNLKLKIKNIFKLKPKIKNIFKLKSKIKNIFKLKSTKKRGKLHKFQNSKVLNTFHFSIQPRNSTKEEQKAYETKQFDLGMDELDQLYLNNIVSNNSCVDHSKAHNFD